MHFLPWPHFDSRATTMPFSGLCALGSMTGSRRLSSSLVITCPKQHFMCASVLRPLLCALQPFQQCATRHAPARPPSLALSMSDQVPSSVPDLMGIVSSMTEENQAAMLAALRERTALRSSSSPLPEALPTDASSTLPPEGASTQDLPEPCTEEPPLVPLLDPARAENFLYQPCSKDEKPWADQLAPELPPADSAPAPVPSQEALPAKPETASTEAPKPRPSPSSSQWPNAPDLPDDALPAKPEVIRKAKPRPFPSEPSRFHEPKPELQLLGLARLCMVGRQLVDEFV